MEAIEPMEAAAHDAQRIFVVTQPPFGARGDGRADDTAAIQRAVDAARAAGGGTVRFPRGTYVVTTVHIAPGMTLEGEDGAVIRRPPRPRGRNAADEARIAGAQKWVRTFTTTGREWDADADSPPLVVRNLTFDGVRAQQGPHQRYEQEQAHLLFLSAATRRPGRLRASVERCRFVDSVGDGVSIYTNCDVRVTDCTARDCFRSGVAVTGGHTRVRIERLVTEGTGVPTGMDVEIDGDGYGKSKRVEIVASWTDSGAPAARSSDQACGGAAHPRATTACLGPGPAARAARRPRDGRAGPRAECRPRRARGCGRSWRSRSRATARASSRFIIWFMTSVPSVWWMHVVSGPDEARPGPVLPGSGGDLVLAGATPGTLAGDDDPLHEELTSPDAPRLGALQRTCQAGLPDGTGPAQRLRRLDLGRQLGEPQVRRVLLARQAAGHGGLVDEVDQGCDAVEAVLVGGLGVREHGAGHV